MTPLRLDARGRSRRRSSRRCGRPGDGPADRHGLRARVRRAPAGRVRADAAHQGARPDEADEHHRGLADTVFTTVLPELLGRAGMRAKRLLPGPVTVVVPNPGRQFRWLCGADPSRIGLRVPVLLPSIAEAIDRIGVIAATSANLPGSRIRAPSTRCRRRSSRRSRWRSTAGRRRSASPPRSSI